jgi:hypothetical protein
LSKLAPQITGEIFKAKNLSGEFCGSGLAAAREVLTWNLLFYFYDSELQ